jgi:hypothetical protein
LKEFSQANRSKAAVGLFWPDEYAYLSTQMEDLEEIQDPKNWQYKSEASRTEEAVNNQILALLSNPAPQGFLDQRS